MLSYYNIPGVREICHAVKQTEDMTAHKRAVIQMSDYLSRQGIRQNSVLIPIPQHTGSAVYTKEIAERIAIATGAIVADILKCTPHEALYTQKKQGLKPDPMLCVDGTIPSTRHIYLVDNVVGTGTTIREALRLFNRTAEPLVFAIDETGAGI